MRTRIGDLPFLPLVTGLQLSILCIIPACLNCNDDLATSTVGFTHSKVAASRTAIRRQQQQLSDLLDESNPGTDKKGLQIAC